MQDGGAVWQQSRNETHLTFYNQLMSYLRPFSSLSRAHDYFLCVIAHVVVLGCLIMSGKMCCWYFYFLSRPLDGTVDAPGVWTWGGSWLEVCAQLFFFNPTQTVRDVDILLISGVKKNLHCLHVCIFQQNPDNYQSANCSEKMRVIIGTLSWRMISLHTVEQPVNI